jgi:hypothetical protein
LNSVDTVSFVSSGPGSVGYTAALAFVCLDVEGTPLPACPSQWPSGAPLPLSVVSSAPSVGVAQLRISVAKYQDCSITAGNGVRLGRDLDFELQDGDTQTKKLFLVCNLSSTTLSANATSGANSFTLGVSTSLSFGVPPSMTNFSFQIGDNSPATSIVGENPGDSLNIGDQLRYSIISGNDWNAFVMDGATIRVANASAVDFEARPCFLLCIRVTSLSGLTCDGYTTVDITDIDDLEITAILPPVGFLGLDSAGGENITVQGKNLVKHWGGQDVYILTYGPRGWENKYTAVRCQPSSTSGEDVVCLSVAGTGKALHWHLTRQTPSLPSSSSAMFMPTFVGYRSPSLLKVAEKTKDVAEALRTGGGDIIVFEGRNLGPEGLETLAVYGISKLSYSAQCIVTVANKVLQCVTAEGVGFNHQWQVTIDGQTSVWSTFTTSYAPPSVTKIKRKCKTDPCDEVFDATGIVSWYAPTSVTHDVAPAPDRRWPNNAIVRI